MTTAPTHVDGSRVVIVTQPVTTTVHDALTTAGYQPDTTTPNCVIYLNEPSNQRPDSCGMNAEPSGIAAQEKLLFTPEEAADALSIGRTKLYELVSSGALSSIRIGSCRRIPAGALADFISDLSENEET
jgi:excisionase family DNA binding protein